MQNKPILKSPKAVAVVAAKKDGDTLSILFKSSEDQGIDLRLDPAILPALVSGLFALLGKLGPQPDTAGITMQPITVIAARQALGPTRQPVLDLTIENGGHLPVTFPRSAIEPLRNALAELLELSKPANEGH